MKVKPYAASGSIVYFTTVMDGSAPNEDAICFCRSIDRYNAQSVIKCKNPAFKCEISHFLRKHPPIAHVTALKQIVRPGPFFPPPFSPRYLTYRQLVVHTKVGQVGLDTFYIIDHGFMLAPCLIDTCASIASAACFKQQT